MKDGPSAALFEADGGAWKLEAVNRIGAFLYKNLPEGITLLVQRMAKYSNLYDDPRGANEDLGHNWKQHLEEAVQQLKGKGYSDKHIMSMVLDALNKA